jgi:hypothetical protein
MTLAEYMSPEFFPLTTQAGLTPEQQVRLDTVNIDEYQEAVNNHHPLDDRQRAVGRELETKRAARLSVLAELAAVAGGQPNWRG